jgi:hypothetical protein
MRHSARSWVGEKPNLTYFIYFWRTPHIERPEMGHEQMGYGLELMGHDMSRRYFFYFLLFAVLCNFRRLLFTCIYG